ncbi:MAG: twin-arginine translocase subunit TatC [Polyangiaceae bacterium]|nr:twin-arginine translocase subunit TatC [Polyangiaceae bacterium]
MTGRMEDTSMTFWEHLEELRTRVIRMAVAFVVGSGITWGFREHLLLWITEPFITAWRNGALPGEPSLHFASPAALFITYITLSLIGGGILSLPFVLFQVWAFVAPGLYSHEKRHALPFVIASTGLFAAGGYFGFRLAFPQAFAFLLSDSGTVAGSSFQVVPTVMIGDYVSFVAQMLLAFGVVFELPVLVFFLSVAGIVTHRHLIKYARHFVIVAFVLGAVLTPPDPVSQLILATPLLLLYTISIGIAYVFGRRSAPETAASESLASEPEAIHHRHRTARSKDPTRRKRRRAKVSEATPRERRARPARS